MIRVFQIIKNHWPLFLILLIVICFFWRLFSPLSIFITPDYGRSDSWHFSISNKFYLSQELKNNRLPIWNPKIGTGFPTLAEGQTGIFFLPNLIIFKFLPFVYAYNFSLVFAFITTAYGTYFFSKSIKFSKETSFYNAIVFSLSAFFVFHVQHNNLLQTASIIPWLFYASNEFLEKKKLKYMVIFSFLLAQAIFAGFPQIVFYSLVILIFYLVAKTYLGKKGKSTVIIFAIFILLGMGLSAIQLIPSYELLNLTGNSASRLNLDDFPYKPINILQILDPFVLGSPKNDSYPRWQPGKWGIFWENSTYIGILPLSFALGVITSTFLKRNKNFKTIFIFTSIGIISLALSLGKFAPLYPIFSVPGFSTFRVPSRFLLFFELMLILISAFFIEKISKKKILFVLITVFSISNLFYYFYNYNPVGKAKDWLSPPQTAIFLKNANASRIYSLGNQDAWDKNLYQKGWQNNDYFYFARNALDQNSNLIFSVDNVLAYESIMTQRDSFSRTLMEKGIKTEKGETGISQLSAEILSSANVSHIITPFAIKSDQFKKVFETEDRKNASFKIYENTSSPKRIFVTDDYKVGKSIGETLNTFNNNFDPTHQIILEENPKPFEKSLKGWQAKIINETPTQIKIETSLEGNGFLVLEDAFYPGWKATVNGKPAKIYPANINKRAVFLGGGTHEVIFKYQPQSLIQGAFLSAFCLIILTLISLKLFVQKPTLI